ncbi:ATP-binding protein [Marinobacterium marinum]|uniref:histidine kinase n=1 Tax=Marinobacterium marinum TaxID=2756129 RepID=A0A7W1WZA9_9GAMM|nr:ATP-binding protein [Marinobacterium marinum]MBA4503000.1 sensor histidine kinase N-terminal domain-containing protein [Marinobacterium marinum]
MTSIRRALSASLLGLVSCAGLVAAALSFWAATDEAEELFDAQMAQMARLVGQLVHTGELTRNPLGGTAEWLPAHPYEKQLSYRIAAPNGDILLVSPSFPQGVSTMEQGYRDLQLDKQWRLFTLEQPARQRLIQVVQDKHIRNELAIKVALTNILPLLIFFPILGLTIWWLIGFHLKPLVTISQQVSTRSSDHLEPLELRRVPDEIDGLVGALNALLARLQQSFERERRFTADAAHELRTPLAALQIHCQNLAQDLHHQEGKTSCQQMLKGLSQLNRIVEQLLQLSRLDPQEQLPDSGQINLSELCRELIGDQVGFAIKRRIDLGLNAPDTDLYVQGNPLYLGLMLRNLIDNALRYTPADGEVTLSLSLVDHAVRCCLTDSGPGIDDAYKQRVFERFYRRDRTEPGSGLGLSIVKLIAERHHAQLQLIDRKDGKQGLMVQIDFSGHQPSAQ